MAKNSADMKLTPEQKKICSNLVDMFDGFVSVSTIKEIVKHNNYDLDRSLAALLKFADSGSKNSSSPKEQKKNNGKGPFNNKPTSMPSSHSGRPYQASNQNFHNEAGDNARGAKKKNKMEQPPKVQMPYSSQPPGNVRPGFSDLPRNYYQGSHLQYVQHPQQISNPRYAAPYSHITQNPRHGAPLIQHGLMPPNANAQSPVRNFSNSYPSSPLRSFPSQSPPVQDPKEIEMAQTYDRVYKIVNDGYKVMVLMRGCPGSGKSHAANEIVFNLFGKAENPKKYVFSADDHFINAFGVYNFNPENLGQAHQKTQAQVTEALKSGITPVIIDNTNTQAWEMKNYVSMAVAYGYFLEVVEPLTSWKFDTKMLTRKSIHNIPLYKVRDMLERYERDLTGKKLLEMNSSKYPAHLMPPQLASNSPKKKFYDSLNAKTNSGTLEKNERKVNENISEMMNSFFKRNQPKSASRAASSTEWSSNGTVSQSQRDHTNIKNLLNNQTTDEASFSKSRFSSASSLFEMVNGLTSSLSQTHLNENKTMSASTKVKKPKKPRKRKKPQKKKPDFSKDYVLLLEDRSMFQRDYSLFRKLISEDSNVDNSSAGASHSSDIANTKDLSNTPFIEGKNVKTCPMTPPHPLSGLTYERRSSRSSIYSSTSTLTGLVAYSDSGSSESEDSSKLYSDSIPVGDRDSDMTSDNGNCGTDVEHSTGVTCDVPDAKCREDNQSLNSSVSLLDELTTSSELRNDTDFMKTWDGSLNDSENKKLNSCAGPKPPRKQVTPSAFSVSDDISPGVEEENANEGVEWKTENNIEAVLSSWDMVNVEVSTDQMVENFLKSLKKPSNQFVPSSHEVKGNDNSCDMATSTDYQQVLSALQGNSSDCQIRECLGRDINAGIATSSKFELQQRLHLDKGSMTEDCIPIVKSSNVDISDLSKVFTPEISQALIGMIEYCHGDINEVISSLIDFGYEITPEQFEILASIPKNSFDISPDIPLKIPTKKEDKVPKVATELPKPKVKQTPTKEALKLKEEFESKIKINPNSYPKFTQQLKRQREHQQEFPSISESKETAPPDESLTFVLDKNLIDQLQQKFGNIDLPYIKDFNPVISIPSSLAFQLYGCVLEAAEENVSQQERLMQEIIASDQKLAEQLQESEVDRNKKTELLDIMDMKLALQLYNADLKALKTSDVHETVANVLSRRLLREMFPHVDPEVVSAMFRLNNGSFHDTVQMIVDKYSGDEKQIFPDLAAQKKTLLVESPAPEPKDEENEASSYTIDDYKEELSYHYQMRTKCFVQAREAYNSGKSQVASYFSQLAFLHKQKMEKASCQLIKREVDNNLTDSLDLHFFVTKDALFALDIFLDNHIKTLRSQNIPSKILYLITGRGTHSPGGVPKVKPAVMKRLQRRSIWYKMIGSNPGLLSVTIYKSMKLSSHFQDEL